MSGPVWSAFIGGLFALLLRIVGWAAARWDGPNVVVPPAPPPDLTEYLTESDLAWLAAQMRFTEDQ